MMTESWQHKSCSISFVFGVFIGTVAAKVNIKKNVIINNRFLFNVASISFKNVNNEHKKLV